jgi:hypothetical protein
MSKFVKVLIAIGVAMIGIFIAGAAIVGHYVLSFEKGRFVAMARVAKDWETWKAARRFINRTERTST